MEACVIIRGAGSTVPIEVRALGKVYESGVQAFDTSKCATSNVRVCHAKRVVGRTNRKGHVKKHVVLCGGIARHHASSKYQWYSCTFCREAVKLR